LTEKNTHRESVENMVVQESQLDSLCQVGGTGWGSRRGEGGGEVWKTRRRNQTITLRQKIKKHLRRRVSGRNP